MKQSKAGRTLGCFALCAALLLAALRVLILKTAFDETGLLPQGSPALPITVLACALCFAGLALLSLRLNRLPGGEHCFTGRPLWLFWKLTGGILLFFGALLTLLDGRTAPDLAQRLSAWGGMLAGLLLVVIALLPKRGAGCFWLRFLAALYTGAALVIRFRVWSHDPMVIHILPTLLAWTCCMVEMMLLSGFSLNAGHRRSAVLFGLAAGSFTCMTAPDYLLGLRTELPELLTLLGLALCCVTAACELLRNRVQSETADKGGETTDDPQQTTDNERQTAEQTE